MTNIKSLLNVSTGLGFVATTVTFFGAKMENPYLTATGINLGISIGAATLVSKKIPSQQSENQSFVELHSLTQQLFTKVENTDRHFQEQQQYLQLLQSQHQQTIEDHNLLHKKINNTQLQLNNHNKKLKKQQTEINTQKSNQNKITSNIAKLNNQQQSIATTNAQHLGKIETQVDKLIKIAPQKLTQSITPSEVIVQKKAVVPIPQRQPQTLVYIDNNNLFNSLKEMGIEPDYESLLLLLTSETGKTRIKLYDGAFINQKYKYAYLKDLGYQIHTLPIVKREKNQFKTVGDDVKLAIDMVKDVKSEDSVILVTGDGDLFPALEEIKQRKVHVTLIAKKSSVNNNLLQLADKFISLESIKYDLAKVTLFSA